MAQITDPSVPRCIPTDDGVNAIGTAARPIQVSIAGIDFDAVNGALAGADAPINVNGQNIVGIGDVSAVGGFRHAIGPFFVTSAASQTDVGLKLGDTVAMGWIAPRAGSVMALSAMLDAAITGAGTTINVRVFKNGTLLNAAFDNLFTQAGAEVADYAVAAKDAYAFAAGDKITVVYTSTAISNTPKVVAYVEVEC